jgi:hypothetical protein
MFSIPYNEIFCNVRCVYLPFLETQKYYCNNTEYVPQQQCLSSTYSNAFSVVKSVGGINLNDYFIRFS